MEGNETQGKAKRKVCPFGNDSTNMDVEEFGCMKEASDQRKKIRRMQESAGNGSSTEPSSNKFIQESNTSSATLQKTESGLQSSSSSDEVSGSWVRRQKSRKLKWDNPGEENLETGTSPLLLPVNSSLKEDLEMNSNVPDDSPDICPPTDRNDAEKQFKMTESIPMDHDQEATCIKSCLQANNCIENDSETEPPSTESNASTGTTHFGSGTCSTSSSNEVFCSSIQEEKSREQEKRENSVERNKPTDKSEGTKSSTCSLSEEEILLELPVNCSLKDVQEENCNALSVFLSRDKTGVEKQFERHDLAESTVICAGLEAACSAHYSNGDVVPDISSSLQLPNRKESPSLIQSVETQPSACSEQIEQKEFDDPDVRIPLVELSALKDEVANKNTKKPLSQEVSLPGNSPKKLLVLDINGLLADVTYRVLEGYTPDTIISGKSVFKRPFCDDFLEFCFARFNVGVWSSRTRRNVELIIDFLMGDAKNKLLFVWDQYHCTDSNFSTLENRQKPLLVKKLKKLWEKYEPSLPWELGEYNESNTLLLDDSPYKAVCNPPYTAVFPTTYRYTNKEDNSLGPGGELRMYLEGLAMAENVQKYVKENPIGNLPITENNPSWRFYREVIHACSSPESSPPPKRSFHWQRYRWRQ